VADAKRLIPTLVVVLAILAGVHAIDASPLGVFYDDAHYAILARALAFGDGYRYVNLPGAPVATHFPPGYAAFLAVLWRIAPDFPENVALFKMANAALLGGVALATFVLARRRFGLGLLPAALAALAGTVTIPALVLASGVMSETLFLALLVPLLLAAEKGSETDGIKTAAWLGVGAGAMALVRSHAVVLIVALAVSYVLRRRTREAVVSAGAGLLVIAPWLIWVQHFDPLMPEPVRGQYGSYGAWLMEGLRADGVGLLWAALRDNTVTGLAIIARSFSLTRHVVFDTLAVLAVFTLGAVGAAECWRRSRVLLLFLAFYLAMTLLWPFSPLRFVWGVWPLLMLLMVSGAVWLWRVGESVRGARLVARTACVVAGSIALTGALVFNVRGYANAWWATVSRSRQPSIQPTLAWVAERTNRDDVIIADDDGAVYLYTGRRALPAAAFTARQHFRPRAVAENAADMAQMMNAFTPDYVVVLSAGTREAAQALAAANPPLLQPLDTILGGRVFRVTGAKATRPAAARRP